MCLGDRSHRGARVSARWKELELQDERTAHKQYAKLLRQKPSLLSAYQGPSNSFWTRSGLPETQRVLNGDLYGRVALASPDKDLLDGGSDFYIGEAYADLNGINVFSWTTPVACTFFRGTDHHSLCDDVAVVRAFRLEDGQIVDFVDEEVRDDAPAEPFKKRGLRVPSPPTRPLPPIPVRPADSSPPLHDVSSKLSESHSLEVAPGGAPLSSGAIRGPIGLRAEELLRVQMEAPRARGLSPVLSTLQPDQYEFVTLPAMESVVIEGQPGTGKTIIASHRAAYLVNEDTPAENSLDGKVLIVGPTAEYSRHIRDVIGRLAGPTERIRVISLPELAYEILGIKQPPRGHTTRSWQDGAWELVPLVRMAIHKLKESNSVAPQLEATYEYLRKNAGMLAKDRDWAQYLRQLPPYREALSGRIHPPLLAFIKWEIAKPINLDLVEHIIVDEAQDVMPLEWLLLDEINEADAWTILGDTNQRRSDHTLANWHQVLDVIAIDPETPIHKLKRAYRSTKPILEYANRLLPREHRKVEAFQAAGPQPTITKVRPTELAETTLREINRLNRTYPRGRVAVISTSPMTITAALRGRGWRTSFSDSQTWEKEDAEVTVAIPDDARGLEFDAVVVVEPSDFPQNLGRKGPLYTALTRANRELSVVHTSSLPDELRRR